MDLILKTFSELRTDNKKRQSSRTKKTDQNFPLNKNKTTTFEGDDKSMAAKKFPIILVVLTSIHTI